jgi:hypothetical protein
MLIPIIALETHDCKRLHPVAQIPTYTPNSPIPSYLRGFAIPFAPVVGGAFLDTLERAAYETPTL